MKLRISHLLILVCAVVFNINCGKSSGGNDPLPPGGPGRPYQKPVSLVEVDGPINTFMTKFEVPGMSVAFTKNGRLVYVKAFGKADKEQQIPVNDSSLFRVASMSKAITSVSIMKLKEAGKLSLDDKVFGPGALLGDTYGTKPYSEGIKAITVKNLLKHTAGGWQNDGQDPMFMNKNMSAGDLISWTLDNQPQVSFPGTQQAYSNFGYCILARIIEKLSGKTYEDYVKSTVFNPSGITKMQIGGSTLAEQKLNEVKYYGLPGQNAYGSNIPRLDGAGGWIASARDYVRFVVSVDGFSSVPDILTTATLLEMTTPNDLPGSNYACGWVVKNNDWSHNGGLPGTNTFMVRTGTGMCGVFLANGKNSKDNFGAELEDLLWKLVRNTAINWPDQNLF